MQQHISSHGKTLSLHRALLAGSCAMLFVLSASLGLASDVNLVLRELGFGPNLQEHPGLAVSRVQISANLPLKIT